MNHAPVPAFRPPARAHARDDFGCLASALHADQELGGAGIRFHRKRADGEMLRRVEMGETDRGYLLGLSLRDGHRRRILGPRRASTVHQFDTDAVYVRNFADPYRADLEGPFDFLLVELPRDALDGLADEAGRPRIAGLNVVTGQPDPVLAALMRALVPVLDRPEGVSTLFLDQIGLAVGTFVAGRYGALPAPALPAGRRLSTLHEARAKERLRASLDGALSIAEIAEACGLSRSYFTQAFRETTGQTPYQWLLAQRVQRACELMAGSALPLAEIATACGFADQSHFTRVFSRATGLPPARWRRSR